MIYGKSHIKSVTFALHVFSLISQLSSDCHQIWQAFFSTCQN